MPDPAVKEKAKEMFVVNGFSMETITQVMDGEVSRKTLYNWRNEKDENNLTWNDKRRAHVQSTANRRERLEAAIDRALDELEVNFNPKLVFSIGKLIGALKQTSTFEFTEEKKDKSEKKKRGLTPERVKEIEKEFGLI